ncbi:MAG: 5-(carboxyamino)imidazole ribonucleotide mutase [Oscillospiraceae bacterium]|nr:5-(carboxyamino)imidazole ribonucleotide mutase [Oscillospiraceae bacterium]
MKKVGIIMGSDSDLPVMQKAAQFLDKIGIEYELTIVSAHRTPERMYTYAKTAKERGIGVIIAGAGGAAHLPGMTASLTSLPVIGVPIETRALGGEDSLLSIVQMPPGIPVAAMAVGGAENAGIMAAEILGVYDEDIYGRLARYKQDLCGLVEAKAAKLETEGSEKYLSG